MIYTSLQQKLGPVGKVGIGQAMKLQWIMLDKSGGQPVVKRKVQSTMALSCNDCNNLLCSTSKGSQLLGSSDFKHDIRTPLQVAEITDGVQKILQSVASGASEVSIVITTCKQASYSLSRTPAQCCCNVFHSLLQGLVYRQMHPCLQHR